MTIEPRAEEPADFPGRVLSFLALLAVLVHGTQGSVDLLAGKKGMSLNLCPADFLLWGAFGIWAIRRIWGRRHQLSLDRSAAHSWPPNPSSPWCGGPRTRRFSWPPVLVGICGTVWLALSLIPQLKPAARGEMEQITVSGHGIIKVIQFAEYFVAGYVVFVEVFREERVRRWTVRLLFAATLVALAVAWVQYLTASAPMTHVCGTWFADRNTFAAFIAIILPLLFGAYIGGECWIGRLGTAVLLVGGLCVVLAGGPFLALCAGLLTTAFLRSRTQFVATALALVLLAGFVLPHLPRRNSAVLLDSVALYKDSDPFGISHGDVTAIAESLKAKNLALSQKIADQKQIAYDDVALENEYSWKWQQHYKEWQSSLNMMARSPLFGVGAGGYQDNVDKFYRPMPKYPKGLLEPDTLSGYMVWGASAGVPFLLILFCLILRGAVSAGRACLSDTRAADDLGETNSDRSLAAGIIGSLVALVILGVFMDPFMVRGLGITAALVLALAQAVERAKAGRPCRPASPGAERCS